MSMELYTSDETKKLQKKFEQKTSKYSKLEAHANRTKASINKIKKGIITKEATLEKYKKLLAELPELIDQLEKNIPEKYDSLNSKSNELTRIVESTEVLAKEIEIINNDLKASKIKDYMSLVSQVNEKNSSYHWIDNNTATTKLMDKLHNCKCDFLLLTFPQSCMCKINGVGTIVWSYVVTDYKPREIPYNYNSDTITEIKKGEGRLKNLLYSECVEILQQQSQDDIKQGLTLPFNIPYSFRAQNSSHQTGFGDYYEWGDLVYQGTKYGDTSDHYIIGFQISQIWQW